MIKDKMTLQEYKKYTTKQGAKSKYGNVKTEYKGKKYDSSKEANRARDLDILESKHEVKDVQTQVSIPILVNGIKVASYKADFVYFDCKLNKIIIEDVKSEFTRKDRVYRLKKKCLEANGYIITEYL